MSKSAAILGLAAIASASLSQPAQYGESSAPVYGGSSSAPVYGGSSSAPYYDPSSSAPVGAPSSSGWPSSSVPYYPGSSVSYSAVPSSSYSYGPSYSSAVPSSTPTPSCWSECFQEAGISSKDELCGNTEVDQCIHNGCDCEDSWAYWQWYDSYCDVPTPSSSVSYYPISSSASVSTPPSSTPTIECWGKCFAENGITSEDELCGNTAVNACISEECDCEDDKAYWAWYQSYCPAPSSSATPTSPVVPPTPTPEDCWGKCFEEAGIASEDELCGNTAVDQCISDSCSPEEDKAYWDWYLSYCPVDTPVTTPCVTPTASATPTPSSPVDTCWTDCFAQYDVSSEAELCGNSDVSKCIHDNCDAALDKAYWDWYNGFCEATSTTCHTITTVITPSSTPYSPVTTTYVSTETLGWAPVESSPATGLPSPPAYPVGPYSSWAPVSSAAPAGTATAPGYPAASSWAPVPATGGSAATKPGVFFAAAMALAAFF